MDKGQGGIKFLESSLCREGNKCAYLVQISQPKLFNSAELICSHDGKCLKVRADLMHLVWCSALLALLGDTSFPNDARIFSSNSRQFTQILTSNVCLHSVCAFLICSIRVGRTSIPTYLEGLFKLPTGHLTQYLNLLFQRNVKPQLSNHLDKLPVQFTIQLEVGQVHPNPVPFTTLQCERGDSLFHLCNGTMTKQSTA